LAVRCTRTSVGELALSYETLTLDADDGLRMALYTAEPESASQQALDLLAEVFDFELASEQVAAIDALDTGVRGGPDANSKTYGREIPEA
jgi:hypothetical protein